MNDSIPQIRKPKFQLALSNLMKIEYRKHNIVIHSALRRSAYLIECNTFASYLKSFLKERIKKL